MGGERVSTKSLVVCLLPDRVDVGVVERGRIIAECGVDLEPTPPTKEPTGPHEPARRALAEAMRRLEVRPGLNALVFHQGTTTITDTATLAGRHRDTLRAAVLSMSESSGDKAAALRLGARQAAIAQRAPSGRITRRLIISSGEHNRVCEAVEDLLEGAGLRATHISPLHATLMLHATRLLQRHDAPGATALLYVGRDCTALAARTAEAGPASCSVARGIEFGTEYIASAIGRGLLALGAAGEPGFERERARQIAARVGLPERDTILDETLGIRGGAVLAYLHPLVQRFVLEVKQTLRFGLGEADLSRVTVLLTGPGSGPPGLQRLLESSLNTTLRLDPPPEGPSASDLAALLSERRGPMRLHSARATRAAEVRSVRRGLAAGIGAAALALAFEAASLQTSLVFASTDLREHDEALAALAAREKLVEQAATLESRVATATSTSREIMGDTPAWAVLLDDLSRAASPQIRLDTIDATGSPQRPSAAITGLAAPGPDGGDALDAYVAALQASPAVLTAELGSTSRTEVEGDRFIRFTVNLTLRVLPDRLAGADTTQGAPR